jgi:hypothetical protein
MDVTKPYKFMGFADTQGPKPYEFIGFGDTHGPKPYKFIGWAEIGGWRAAGVNGFDGVPWHHPMLRSLALGRSVGPSNKYAE